MFGEHGVLIAFGNPTVQSNKSKSNVFQPISFQQHRGVWCHSSRQLLEKSKSTYEGLKTMFLLVMPSLAS